MIGSDSPEISAGIVREAFDRLEDHDAVIGPAHDGGYYLLGFKRSRFVPEAFDAIAWSTPQVFRDTMEILRRSGRSCCVLEKLHDVDTLEDLSRFIKRNTDGALKHSQSMNYLREADKP